MFKRILIANRGEIACRVIKTARRMGVQTVAVYSEADRDALHVEMADEAVLIGPPAAAESYLVIEKIVEACRKTGAEAVHPGYGFLSEREAFPRALEAAGIVFIGPNPGAIAAMGDKIESKRAAAKAKVSTVPGYLGVIEDATHAVKIADEIGYPVMIKASAGGGGKGMRIAHSTSEVAEGFNLAKAEAKASFGDDRVFIEKFIVDPRHIEIQLLGDKHGNVIYLGERECSIQRRNQKVIEEAPSPLLDEATRRKMGEQAVALAKAVNYDSAGTVEFVAGQDKSFYFLEMNTRLQVEHPVTELVTGVDLVEQMLRVAAGEKLAIAQKDVTLTGWAVESRLYAEDPFRNFLPSIGRLVKYRPPAEASQDGITVRNDTGVQEGGEISIHYDPMIAKLVTHAPSRAAAIEAQATALDSFYVDGIRHNIPFLSALMHHPRWREGRLSTGFIAEEFPKGFAVRVPEGEVARRLAAVGAAIDHVLGERKRQISGQMGGRIVQRERRRAVWLDRQEILLEIAREGEAVAVRFVNADGKTGNALLLQSPWKPGDPVWQGTIDGHVVAVQVRPIANGIRLAHQGVEVPVYVWTEAEAASARLMPVTTAADTGKKLLCPMPGLVVSIAVTEGQEVKAGETLAVVEAMKMQNVLRAEQDGTVKKIHASAGATLAVDALILEFA
ncbi:MULTISPECIES: acetyl/propionyl/methylcrotonyl-CoA carboxylase subunit alpha [unclassified Bradyrhizobium]|jgi:propionyl-CoA carboxylase alpha chain|uniref:acetyl-CoA carboxylase biotin carboxylase subunit n=1 Tax=unclassified Bradyrhizobium TaxID=2631580 RepID=UPI001FF7CC95|nr:MULTISPECIES: acetyl/propionyl/methylcrotonyl-CoA carboxylase subunit alpha [unclassified Bradyrhizobium]MCK1571040.1 acetyl/propionyl/methylcrotonyl-CoA carboxylase subunit alpha [Bradyrhizobium sp. 174]MCK1588269.1 acetyl/propionyl/methylcrotonyl-CoA carboxylase subunit alpha [Bradyrhizobium sp. 169]UPJ70264.1 acetyl/propionyl/methylcrotonyl-CoA carboxylase subunit alpha [Bradyrhizobium sp. 187]UPJ83402.1 acetyl/propionyl/methylcrotonyl-CoA carboxylase subunit alpha [Bradyrhizobium sp. 184